MDREEIITLLDVQRKHFNDTLDRIQRQFSDAVKDVDKKISDVITSLEFTQSRLDESLPDINIIQQIKHNNELVKNQLVETKNRLDYIDDQGRRNNLKFSGIAETPSENWEQCQRKVEKLVCEQMKLPAVSLERAHRIGRITSDKPRDIVAKFKCYPEREAVYRNRRNLMGTNVFVNEDLCPATQEIRRQQMDALKEARQNGKIAYFNYRTLVVREQRRGGPGAGYRQPAGNRLSAGHRPTARHPPSRPRRRRRCGRRAAAPKPLPGRCSP